MDLRVENIRPNLRRWTAPHPAWTPKSVGWDREVGCVHYETTDAIVLVDPLAPPDEALLWRELDRQVERTALPVMVVLTAPWHVRSTDAVVRRYDATVWAHPAGLHRLDRDVDAVLPRGVDAFEIPPVDEGQVVLFVPEHGALIAAEVLTGRADGLEVCPSPRLKDRGQLASCLRRLLELPIEVVLPAHGPPVAEHGRVALAAAVAHWAPSAA